MRREARRIVRNTVGVLTALAVSIVLAGCDLLNRITPTLPPDRAPTGVAASLGQFETQIRVTWLSVERATSYRVYRADSRDGDYQLLGSESALVYTDTVGAANQGRMYWYRIEACNAAGCSPTMSAAVAGYAGYPPAPTNVRATDRTHPQIGSSSRGIPFRGRPHTRCSAIDSPTERSPLRWDRWRPQPSRTPRPPSG